MYYDQTDLELGPGMVNPLGTDMWIGFVSVEFKKKMVTDRGRKSALNDSQFNVHKWTFMICLSYSFHLERWNLHKHILLQ